MKKRSLQQFGLLLTSVILFNCSEQNSSGSNNVAQSGSDNMTVRDTPKGLDYDFYKESIEPIFIRHRGGFVGSDTSCVACHTVQANAPLGLVALTEENGEVFGRKSSLDRILKMLQCS